MSRKNRTDGPPVDLDKEDLGGRIPNRKQVLDMLRRKESFVDIDLRGADLSAIVFDGVDLREAKFAEANLSRCSFRGADLRRASFWSANLKDASFEGADLEEADLEYAYLDGVSFKAAKVRKTTFTPRRVSPDAVRRSVATGERLRMEAPSFDDLDDED